MFNPKVLVAAGAALATAICIVGTPVHAAVPTTASKVEWRECGDNVQCAMLPVPLDHQASSRTSRTISLGMSKRSATGERRGTIIITAGTQNGGATSLVHQLQPNLKAMNVHYDLVGVDTRGVGHSSPAVLCTTFEENRVFEAPLSASQTTTDREARITEARNIAAKCRERSGDLLPYMGTTQSVEDLERVRVALGEPRLNLLAMSQGSVLGQAYLAHHGDHMDKLILDSPFDSKQWVQHPFAFDRDQMVATEQTLDTFFSWCKKNPANCRFGTGDPRAAFERMLADKRRTRLENPGHWDLLTDGALIDMISGGMISPPTWPQFSRSLEDLSKSSATPVQLQTGWDTAFSEYYSESCLDRALPRDVASYDRALKEAKLAAPYLGGRYGYAEFKCQQWPVAPKPLTDAWLNPAHVDVLVLSARHDPLAPWVGAVRTANRLDARRVDIDAPGHLQMGRSECVDRAVDTFLASGAQPRIIACTASIP